MSDNTIKRSYFQVKSRVKAVERRFQEDFPNGMDLRSYESINRYIKLVAARSEEAAFWRILAPRKDIIITDEMLDEIFDDYEKSETEEEEDRVLKRFYDLYEVRKDDIDEE